MTRKFKRLSHSIYECKYHIVFCPKYRMRILKGEVAEYTRQQIYQLCGQKDQVEVLEINVQAVSERQTGDQTVKSVRESKTEVLGRACLVAGILCEQYRAR